MTDSISSIDQLKSSMRAAWMAGDFGVIAKSNARIAEEFVGRPAIVPHLRVTASRGLASRVLDVACGTGNLAIPLARLGAVVTGVDIATNLLHQARERASAEGLAITFDEGDAEALPYPDACFDAVVTMFGAMFAPRPDLVAAELARVVRPGGLLAMANWNPDSFSGAMFKINGKHVPPPPGVVPPVLWGDDATVRRRLDEAFTDIRTQLIAIEFDLPMNPAAVVAFFRKYFGPTQVAFSRLDQAGQAAMAADLEALWASENIAADPLTQTLVRNQYLQVTAIRR